MHGFWNFELGFTIFSMNKEELKQRTKHFALRVMPLVDQLLRSATSVPANYRAACRARSTAEFIAKLGNVLEEVDKGALWMELIIEGELLKQSRVSAL
jgi:four helix bundle protein